MIKDYIPIDDFCTRAQTWIKSKDQFHDRDIYSQKGAKPTARFRDDRNSKGCGKGFTEKDVLF
jgi:hypothetical protein